MTFDDFKQTIIDLPVFDTHTHMNSCTEQSTKGLYARNFHDVCWYFWFHRELASVGYDVDRHNDLEEKDYPEDAKKLNAALHANRNTYWTNTVMQAMEDLYQIRPDSVDKILELDAKMKANVDSQTWGNEVCAKLNIQKIASDPDGIESCDRIKDKIVWTPFIGFEEAVKGIRKAQNQDDAIEEFLAKTKASLAGYAKQGVRTIRPEWPFVRDMKKAAQKDFTKDELKDDQNLKQFLGHRVFEMFNEHRFNLQVFFGMSFEGIQEMSDLPLVRTYAQNQTNWVSSMHNVFEMYLDTTFELFSAVELSSLDMVQAARIYPNVYPGGMWWFNYRRSVFEKNMQYRIEGISAKRCSLVVSDARCIEWSYIKILYIKKILAQFLYKQVQDGWVNEETALFTAQQWLHDTAAELYS